MLAALVSGSGIGVEEVIWGISADAKDVGAVDEVEMAAAVASMLAAALAASSICSSDTGFSSSLQPVCIGTRRSDSTLDSPSEHSSAMQAMMLSSKLSLEALHMFFWSSSLSVL